MNNAKEKAREIVEEIRNYLTDNETHCALGIENDLALMSINIIIASSPSLPILSDNGSFGSDIEESTEWWKEVREEIKNYESTN